MVSSLQPPTWCSAAAVASLAFVQGGAEKGSYARKVGQRAAWRKVWGMNSSPNRWIPSPVPAPAWEGRHSTRHTCDHDVQNAKQEMAQIAQKFWRGRLALI